ncbi:MAG: hypothetical protein Q9220_003376 [cf. Caloplaca sp. 1 TL-2023]
MPLLESADTGDIRTLSQTSSVEQQHENSLPPTSSEKKSLFVHSLPTSATTEALTNLFSQAYPLKHATVVLDPSSGLSKGYGFVTFADPRDASSALEIFNGALFEGKKIKVALAESRSRGPQASTTNDSNNPGGALAGVSETKASHGRRQDPNEVQTQLIVRNLPWTISEPEQLALLFRSYGKIKRITIPKKPAGLSAGFGFVVLRGRKNAEKALMGVNGKVVDGRTLAVDWAVRKEVWEKLHQNTEVDGPDQASSALSIEPTVVADDHAEEPHTTEGDSDDEDHASSTSPSDPRKSPDTEGDFPRTSGQDGENQGNLTTLFARNVPFEVTDEILIQHFASFGPVRYARIVMDPSTEKSKGTAFICFYNEADATQCLRNAPQNVSNLPREHKDQSNPAQHRKKSILEDTQADSSGRYSIEGRLLQVTRAVDRSQAVRFTAAGHAFRDQRDRDKRHLYLLGEGTIPRNTPLYDRIAPSELVLREESAKQRQNLIKNNPALHVSLTRLSVRNLPRDFSSKDLKALAREAVVGFARDVKAGLRQTLSKEELSRAAAAMQEAERSRKMKGKGIVKQAKVVFEGRTGGKVTESSGAGRSKCFGFLEYTSHRTALMGLRWLNGHPIKTQSKTAPKVSNFDEKPKRLIVEFAMENSQVIGRRQGREAQARDKASPRAAGTRPKSKDIKSAVVVDLDEQRKKSSNQAGRKRKRSREAPQLASRTEINQSKNKQGAAGRPIKKRKMLARQPRARSTPRSD